MFEDELDQFYLQLTKLVMQSKVPVILSASSWNKVKSELIEKHFVDVLSQEPVINFDLEDFSVKSNEKSPEIQC